MKLSLTRKVSAPAQTAFDATEFREGIIGGPTNMLPTPTPKKDLLPGGQEPMKEVEEGCKAELAIRTIISFELGKDKRYS